MKAANNKATLAKRELELRSVESFVPMRRCIRKNRNGVDTPVLVPLLSSWIFVKSTYLTLQELNRTIDYLYPLYDRTTGNKDVGVAMSVPTAQMEEFISFISGNEERVQVIDAHGEIDITRGERVRITSGPFSGRTATFIKIKGRRSKQVVVKIDGFAAVTTTTPFTVERI